VGEGAKKAILFLVKVMELSRALELFLESQIGEVSAQTQRGYRQRLAVVVKGLGAGQEVEAITPEMLRRWRADLVGRGTRYADHPGRPTEQGGVSPHTLHSYVQAVKYFFQWLMVEGYMPHNPAERLRLPRLPEQTPKAISDLDLKLLLAEARRSGSRDYAIVLFLADTGCRVGGLCSLLLSDLDLPARRAVVKEKGGKARTLYFVDHTASALAAWLAERPAGGAIVFTGRLGPLKPNGVYQLLKRLARRAGVQGRWNPHSLRHAAARSMLQNGANLSTVSRILGHSDIGVTARFYTRWTDNEIAQEHDRVSPLNRIAPDG